MAHEQVPSCRDQMLTVDGGKVYIDGKAHWPDMVRLRLPADRALDLAMELLRAYQLHKRRGYDAIDGPYLPELVMVGKLETVPSE